MSVDALRTIDWIDRLERFLERIRPDEDIRDKLDIGYQIDGQSVYVLEIRPDWFNPSAPKREFPVAKATYVKSRDLWQLFWRRASGKWERYPAQPETKTLAEFLNVVGEDKHNCFFG